MPLQRLDGAEILARCSRAPASGSVMPRPRCLAAAARRRLRSCEHLAETRRQHAGHGQGRGAAQHRICAAARQMHARRGAVAARRDRIGQGLRPCRPAAPAAATGASPPSMIVSGSNRFSMVGDRIAEEAVRPRQPSGFVAAAGRRPALRATDSARGSRDCRRGRARRPAPAACGRSRRHCPRRRAARRRHAPWRRRARRRNRGSRIRAVRVPAP